MTRRTQKISILGATGSVGASARQVLAEGGGEDLDFSVTALTAQSNVEGLANAAIKHAAEYAAIADPALYPDLKERLSGTPTRLGAGIEGIIEAASLQADVVVSGIVGVSGLRPTLAALEAGANVALANKESMVCGGALLKDAARRTGAHILPIDSEHNAVFQLFSEPERIEKVTLTASGGPFRQRTKASMATITPEEAVKHPNWSMGAKISVDSATMMNKGLELIEAAYLFDLPPERLDVVVHPQSIVHALLAYDDGSVLAHLAEPDMCVPIAYALGWPHRCPLPTAKRLDLAEIGRLDFEAPDYLKFPALRLAIEALRAGGAAPLILNASNEVAVEAFLQDRIGFCEIAETVEAVLTEFGPVKSPDERATIEDILALDDEARQKTAERLSTLAELSGVIETGAKRN